MPSFAVMPNYKRCQPNNLTVGLVETNLPAVNSAIMPYPSKVFVQALAENTESIYIGPTGVLATGAGAVYQIQPGASLFLPSHVIDQWKMICASGGQNVLLTYFSGVF